MIYNNAELYNVSELIETDNGSGKLCTRIPDSVRQKLNLSAQNNALQCAGCELRFNLIGDHAELTIAADVPNQWNIDSPIVEIYQGCFNVGWKCIQKNPTTIKIEDVPYKKELQFISKTNNLPFDSNLTRIILPYRPSLKLIELTGDIAPPELNQTPQIKYLAYGSSITHGYASVRPTETYAMQTAQTLGVDLINLGFGGGAYLEPQIANYICDRDDWHFATLEMGINVLQKYTPDQFLNHVEYFVDKISHTHKDKWIFCIDMFSFERPELLEIEKEKKFRKIIQNKVLSMNLPKFIHISGMDLLKNPEGLAADLLHPSPLGMSMIARNLSSFISQKLNCTLKGSSSRVENPNCLSASFAGSKQKESNKEH